ncbi:MAG TPA: hypothetical protein VGP33_18760, partial [Chloroflexota bacterium]|nr:hypothetical protein [Chloroflexota bacterium]
GAVPPQVASSMAPVIARSALALAWIYVRRVNRARMRRSFTSYDEIRSFPPELGNTPYTQCPPVARTPLSTTTLPEVHRRGIAPSQDQDQAPLLMY